LDLPPSFHSKAKYCDITGLEAKYTDPKTGLNYHSSDVFKFIETLSHADAQNYLGLRGKAVDLK
jgi:INO80 complex subunit C